MSTLATDPRRQASPDLQIRAIETLADVLETGAEADRGDDFYGRISEATTRLTTLRRAVVFRYDSARRHVHLAGGFGIDLSRLRDIHVTVESAPIGRQALEQDRVIEAAADVDAVLPAEYARRFDLTNIVVAPMVANGRWIGVIAGDRDAAAPAPDERERELLWILGKAAALISMARTATRQHEKAQQLEQRIDLARDLHDGVVQRLFGVSLALSGDQLFDQHTRQRCAEEVQRALADLKTAVTRPLGRAPARTNTTLRDEVERLRLQHPDLRIDVHPGAQIAAPPELEPLAQAVLAEAIRNAHKHASPREVRVHTKRRDGAFVLEVTNDGVKEARVRSAGMGLRLAAFEALQAGGLLEFGMRGSDCWQVRLVVRSEGAT